MTSKWASSALVFAALIVLALPSASEAAGCKCLGAQHPNSTKFGNYYGARCSAWDVLKSTEYWPDVTPGLWSCKSWCYVNNTDCDTGDVEPSWDKAQTNLFWSYKACPGDPKMDTEDECPWKGKAKNDTVDWAKASYNPCGCSGGTQPDTAKFGKDYGSKCEAWDSMKCSQLWPTSGPGSWCCMKWCYTQGSCPSSSASWSGTTALYFNYGTCADDKDFLKGCPWKPIDKAKAPDFDKAGCDHLTSYAGAAAITGADELTASCTPKPAPPPSPPPGGSPSGATTASSMSAAVVLLASALASALFAY